MATFAELWKNHPNITGEEPLLDKRQYDNQCAINLYTALQRSGVSVKSFHGQLSWQKDKPKYAIRAQEVANWLASAAHPIFPAKVEKFEGKEVFEKIKGKTGIIFFQNYWGAGNQGDHIDLWNGSRLTDWRTWVRIHIRIGEYGLHNLGAGSDFQKAASVWFWAVP